MSTKRTAGEEEGAPSVGLRENASGKALAQVAGKTDSILRILTPNERFIALVAILVSVGLVAIAPFSGDFRGLVIGGLILLDGVLILVGWLITKHRSGTIIRSLLSAVKVRDRVRIRADLGGNNAIFEDGIVVWKSGMKLFLGREATVTEVIQGSGPDTCRLDVDGGRFLWSLTWLEKI